MKQVTYQIIAVCLTAVVISVNDTNYGPLIPILQQDLHLNGGQVALLLSTPFFAGMVLSSLLGGVLADRYSVRAMMLGSLLPLIIGQILLPLPPLSLPSSIWIGIMRGVVGLGAGVAFVSSARIMSLLGKYAGLGQGLNGSAGVLGPALGLALTPLFRTSFGWRGAFVVWGLAGAGAYVIWSWMPDIPSFASTKQLPCHPLAVWRCVPGWALGLTFMGTAGLGNAIFAWLPIYFVSGYHLSLTLAGGIGAMGLLAGTLCRPLGGIVLEYLPSLTIIRASTLAIGLGICLLALPITCFPSACLGVVLLAFGTTTPQAAIFNTIAEVGERYGLGRGLAQGMILVATAPALCAASPLIGFFLGRTSSFTVAFGVTDFLFGGTAVLASWYTGPLLADLGMGTVGTQHMRGAASRSQEVLTIVLHQATLLGEKLFAFTYVLSTRVAYVAAQLISIIFASASRQWRKKRRKGTAVVPSAFHRSQAAAGSLQLATMKEQHPLLFHPAKPSSTVHTLRYLFASALDLRPEDILATSDFFQCGGDSASLAVLLTQIDSAFQMHLEPDAVFDHPRLLDLAAAITRHGQRSLPQQTVTIVCLSELQHR